MSNKIEYKLQAQVFTCLQTAINVGNSIATKPVTDHKAFVIILLPRTVNEIVKRKVRTDRTTTLMAVVNLILNR